MIYAVTSQALGFLAILAATGWAFGQTGILGNAPVTLQEGTADCGGSCVTVDVFVDVTGLTGTGGDAGLNAFVIAFDLNRSDVFASATPGVTPLNDWGFLTTERALVDMTNRLVLVGAAADDAAPNQNYHVASVVFCGSTGDVTLTFVASESSLGSRVVAGDGPGPIGIGAPAPFIVPITINFPLDWGAALSFWRTNAPSYDLVAPTGAIDVLDLSKLNHCGQP